VFPIFHRVLNDVIIQTLFKQILWVGDHINLCVFNRDIFMAYMHDLGPESAVINLFVLTEISLQIVIVTGVHCYSRGYVPEKFMILDDQIYYFRPTYA